MNIKKKSDKTLKRVLHQKKEKEGIKDMKATLVKRIINEGIVDTKNYRYVLEGNHIKRLPIEYLDTTDAIDGWEVVKEL